MPQTRLARQTLSVQEAAQYVGLGRTKFGELIRRGEIPSLKVGTRRLIPITALDRWLGTCMGSSPTQTDGGGAA